MTEGHNIASGFIPARRLLCGDLMKKDTFQLLKYAFISIFLIVVWFGLASLSRNIVVEILLGWVGFVPVGLYWRWLLKNKVDPPKL